MDEIDVLPKMTTTATAPKDSQDVDDQDHGEKVRAIIDGGSHSSSCSDTPPSLSPSSSLLPISMSTSRGEERTMIAHELDSSGVNYISSISVTTTMKSAATDRTESLIQPPALGGQNETLPPAAAETTAKDSTTQMLEARVLQLEQALRALVTTLQGQQVHLYQQNHYVSEQHQEIDEATIQQQHQPGHSREGSDVSSYPFFCIVGVKKIGCVREERRGCDFSIFIVVERSLPFRHSLLRLTRFSQTTAATMGGSGATRSSSSSPPTPNSPWSDPTLSQWPPSNNHCLLESPDHFAHTLGRRRYYRQRSRRRPLQQPILKQNQNEKRNPQLHHAKKKGKTMSMVLLDIDADENRGPRYVIPFTSSDLDVCCGDEITDGDSINSGRIEKGAGGEEQDELEDIVIPSVGRASPHKIESGNGISGTTNLTCQGYSDAHWEALRLRHEAGRGDRRAYSYNDRDFRSDSTTYPKQSYRPTLEAIPKGPNSATSADITFVENGPKKLQEEKAIVISDLNFPDVIISASHGRNLLLPQDQLVKIDRKYGEAGVQSVEGCGNTVMGENIIAHFSSCNSITSSDTTQTAKAVNTNDETSPRGSTNAKCKERSISIASAKLDGGNSTLLQYAETTGDVTASIYTSTTLTPKGQKSHKSGSPPYNHLSQEFTTLAESKSKNSQTMKEYVMNDLLNIDSRNQDGSATEDVDANMEEFLRIPPNLEYLMFFSLAVCMDSFLYVWTMLPLKLVWCVVCLACSVYSPKNGVRGVRFHRR